MHNLHDWIMWVVRKEKDEKKNKQIWELYLHTGALIGKDFDEWKEKMNNG